MNNPLILFTLCIMASMTSFAQSELKNGVYEFSTTNSTRYETETSRRTLIVENDTTVHYSIYDRKDGMGFYSGCGNFGGNPLKLEKHVADFYKAHNEFMELHIRIINSDTIDVEVINSIIYCITQTGQQIIRESFLSETKTLTFVRELTAEDEEMLKDAKRLLEYYKEWKGKND